MIGTNNVPKLNTSASVTPNFIAASNASAVSLAKASLKSFVIKIIKRGATAIGNYFWDLIVSNVDCTYGYEARYA